MHRLARAALATTLLVAAGCASVPMMPEDADRAAKTFAPPPADRAHVYVYRNEGMGAAIKMDLLLNGQPVFQSAAKTYVLLPVAPGSHTLTSKSENTADLALTAEGGHTYYVWQEVKMGLLYARTKLNLVDEPTGQAGVRDCKLARTNQQPVATPPPPPPAVPGA